MDSDGVAVSRHEADNMYSADKLDDGALIMDVGERQPGDSSASEQRNDTLETSPEADGTSSLQQRIPSRRLSANSDGVCREEMIKYFTKHRLGLFMKLMNDLEHQLNNGHVQEDEVVLLAGITLCGICGQNFSSAMDKCLHIHATHVTVETEEKEGIPRVSLKLCATCDETIVLQHYQPGQDLKQIERKALTHRFVKHNSSIVGQCCHVFACTGKTCVYQTFLVADLIRHTARSHREEVLLNDDGRMSMKQIISAFRQAQKVRVYESMFSWFARGRHCEADEVYDVIVDLPAKDIWVPRQTHTFCPICKWVIGDGKLVEHFFDHHSRKDDNTLDIICPHCPWVITIETKRVWNRACTAVITRLISQHLVREHDKAMSLWYYNYKCPEQHNCRYLSYSIKDIQEHLRTHTESRRHVIDSNFLRNNDSMGTNRVTSEPCIASLEYTSQTSNDSKNMNLDYVKDVIAFSHNSPCCVCPICFTIHNSYTDLRSHLKKHHSATESGSVIILCDRCEYSMKKEGTSTREVIHRALEHRATHQFSLSRIEEFFKILKCPVKETCPYRGRFWTYASQELHTHQQVHHPYYDDATGSRKKAKRLLFQRLLSRNPSSDQENEQPNNPQVNITYNIALFQIKEGQTTTIDASQTETDLTGRSDPITEHTAQREQPRIGESNVTETEGEPSSKMPKMCISQLKPPAHSIVPQSDQHQANLVPGSSIGSEVSAILTNITHAVSNPSSHLVDECRGIIPMNLCTRTESVDRTRSEGCAEDCSTIVSSLRVTAASHAEGSSRVDEFLTVPHQSSQIDAGNNASSCASGYSLTTEIINYKVFACVLCLTNESDSEPKVTYHSRGDLEQHLLTQHLQCGPHRSAKVLSCRFCAYSCSPMLPARDEPNWQIDSMLLDFVTHMRDVHTFDVPSFIQPEKCFFHNCTFASYTRSKLLHHMHTWHDSRQGSGLCPLCLVSVTNLHHHVLMGHFDLYNCNCPVCHMSVWSTAIRPNMISNTNEVLL